MVVHANFATRTPHNEVSCKKWSKLSLSFLFNKISLKCFINFTSVCNYWECVLQILVETLICMSCHVGDSFQAHRQIFIQQCNFVLFLTLDDWEWWVYYLNAYIFCDLCESFIIFSKSIVSNIRCLLLLLQLLLLLLPLLLLLFYFPTF